MLQVTNITAVFGYSEGRFSFPVFSNSKWVFVEKYSRNFQRNPNNFQRNSNMVWRNSKKKKYRREMGKGNYLLSDLFCILSGFSERNFVQEPDFFLPTSFGETSFGTFSENRCCKEWQTATAKASVASKYLGKS